MKYRLFIEIIENGKPLRFSYVAKSLRDCERLINRHYFDYLIEVEIRDNNTDNLLAFYYNISRKSAPLKYVIFLNKYSFYQIKKQK